MEEIFFPLTELRFKSYDLYLGDLYFGGMFTFIGQP